MPAPPHPPNTHARPHSSQVRWAGPTAGPAAKHFSVRCRPDEDAGKLLRRALRKSALVHMHVHAHMHVHVHAHMHVHVLCMRICICMCMCMCMRRITGASCCAVGCARAYWLLVFVLSLAPPPPHRPHLRPRQVNATPAALVGASAAAARLVTSDGGVLEAGRPLHWCACHRWGWGLGYGWVRGLD